VTQLRSSPRFLIHSIRLGDAEQKVDWSHHDIGVLGSQSLGGLPWIDALVKASMILEKQAGGRDLREFRESLADTYSL